MQHFAQPLRQPQNRLVRRRCRRSQQDIKLTGTPGKTVAAADIADDLLRDVNDRNTQRLYLLCGGFLKAVHLAHLDYHAVHRTALQMNLQFTHGLLQLLSVHVVIRNHIPQKILTQQRTALLVVTRKQRRGGSILRSNGAQAVQQLLRIEVQLEQIVPCAQLERLLDQFELVVAAQHQNFRRRALLPQLTDELDTVHARHFDISNDDVRLLFLYELHRLSPFAASPTRTKPFSSQLMTVLSPMRTIVSSSAISMRGFLICSPPFPAGVPSHRYERAPRSQRTVRSPRRTACSRRSSTL